MDNLSIINDFIKKQVEEVSPLLKKRNLSFWDASISGDKEDYEEYEKSNIELEKIYHNKEDFEKIKNWKLQNIDNPLIKRQIDILYNSYLGSQGDLELIKTIIKKSTEIERKFNTFRAEVNGKQVSDNEIKEILKKETNSVKLKEAWESSKKQGELVEKEVIELVKLRNQLARSLGFENYYLMSLKMNEQTEEQIENIFNCLEEGLKKPFEILKQDIDKFLINKYKISFSDLKPWHYNDLFFQEAPEIYAINWDSFYTSDVIETAKNFYKGIGFNVEGIIKRSDLYEKSGKYQHACCIDIDRKGDVRILQNTKNNEYWMETTLHELGHGIYSECFGKIDENQLPFILRDSAHTFITEAIALFFGRQSTNPSFINKYSSVSNHNLNKIKEDSAKFLRLNELVFSKWSQVMFRFEREMYKNPNQNLNILWWNLVEEYQLISFSRDKPDWASKIHIVTAPAYYHNYLLGKLLASQLTFDILKNVLKSNSASDLDYSEHKELAEYLKQNIFCQGMKYRWDELIKKATGEQLNPDYFIKEFS